MRRVILLVNTLIMALSGVFAQKPLKAYVVSNAHFDTQWNWTVQTSIDEYVAHTLRRNLWLLDRYPNYLFNFEGGVKYSWMKEYYPAEYERLKEYVAAGRWHIAGASWDANDTHVPSPESALRNILLGQEFYKSEFGVKSDDVFLPDCFGFSATLPTIASHAGLVGFSTQKLQWRNKPFYGEAKVPFDIGIWHGIDGSSLYAALNGNDYTHRWNGEDISRDEDLKRLASNSPLGIAYRYYGTGDRGGSPTIPSVVSVEKGLKGDGDVQIVAATSSQLYHDLKKEYADSELPQYTGELLMDIHGTGCYTSQAAMKLYNRRNEQLADAAERISVMAHYYTGYKYPKERLNENWRRFIWHQFHDDLTGTSIPEAYPFSWNDEIIAQTDFADLIQTAAAELARRMDTRAKGTPVLLYNPVATVNSARVVVKIPVANTPRDVRVLAPDKRECPAQIVSVADGVAQVAFTTSVPPVSLSVYDIQFTVSEKSQTSKYPRASGNTLENSIYRITLDACGDIASIIDKRCDKELVAQGKRFRLALIPDNESYYWPAWEIHKHVIDKTPLSVGENVRISVAEQGAGSAALRVERSDGKSRYVQYIRLTEGACDDRIDIVTEIDWASKASLLKAEFNTAITADSASYDLGVGHIRRGNNTPIAYEVPARQWADLSQDDYGITIMTDSKYGWDKPSDSTIRLTLLHTPHSTFRDYAYQSNQDLGFHRFTYSIVGHIGTPHFTELSLCAEQLNNPLIPYVVPAHKGDLGKQISFLSTEGGAVLNAMKRAENIDACVVRVYEKSGVSQTGSTITFPAEIEWAAAMNGAEEVIAELPIEGNVLTYDIHAFGIKTFAVRLKNTAQSVTNDTHYSFLPLQRDFTAFTPDPLSSMGTFDPAGNSYAAELLPDTIYTAGIPFVLPANPGEGHIMRCEGQTIPLPDDRKYTHLYLLAASSEEDRNVTFMFDDTSVPCRIPYYSDFYAQWGHTGLTTGYVREHPLAYIGTHRHTKAGRNEPYKFTYIYRIALPIPSGAETLRLPDDYRVAIFAAAVAVDTPDDITPAAEIRALSIK
ncbi:MAG: alpha-mannosidase [Coprobacter sp.]|nr:alpha-mannosidase [Coprobacter sp.]